VFDLRVFGLRVFGLRAFGLRAFGLRAASSGPSHFAPVTPEPATQQAKRRRAPFVPRREQLRWPEPTKEMCRIRLRRGSPIDQLPHAEVLGL
jgi:hypothetical protein